MVWRNKHRASRRKREHIAALQKRPTITAVETGHYVTDRTKHLRRAAWRAQHANRSIDHNIETIDITQEAEETSNPESIERTESPPEGTSNPESIERTESPPTVYTTNITKLFTRIEQYLLIILINYRICKRKSKSINNLIYIYIYIYIQGVRRLKVKFL